jgi:hypothetical protein
MDTHPTDMACERADILKGGRGYTEPGDSESYAPEGHGLHAYFPPRYLRALPIVLSNHICLVSVTVPPLPLSLPCSLATVPHLAWIDSCPLPAAPTCAHDAVDLQKYVPCVTGRTAPRASTGPPKWATSKWCGCCWRTRPTPTRRTRCSPSCRIARPRRNRARMLQ